MPKKLTKTAAIKAILKGSPSRTNAEIAKEVGCSPSLVIQQRSDVEPAPIKAVNRRVNKRKKADSYFSFDDLAIVHECAIKLGGCDKLLATVAAYGKLDVTPRAEERPYDTA